MTKQDYRIERAERYLSVKGQTDFEETKTQNIEAAIIQDLLDIIYGYQEESKPCHISIKPIEISVEKFIDKLSKMSPHESR